MDDGRPDLVKILEGVDNLHYDGAALLLRHELVLLQIEVKVVPLTILQNRAEPGTDGGNKNNAGLDEAWVVWNRLRNIHSTFQCDWLRIA